MMIVRTPVLLRAMVAVLAPILVSGRFRQNVPVSLAIEFRVLLTVAI